MIMPDSLLNETALLNAIHSVWSLAYLDEYEEALAEGVRGLQTPGPVQIEEWAPRLPDETLCPLAWYLIGRTQQAWGQTVGLVFHHAGIKTEDDQYHALTDLFLGCQGHGVSLRDDFKEEISKAEGVLGRYSSACFKLVPFHDDMGWLRELAREVVMGSVPQELISLPAWGVANILGEQCQGKHIPRDAAYFWDDAYYPAAALIHHAAMHTIEMPDGTLLPDNTALTLFRPATESLP